MNGSMDKRFEIGPARIGPAEPAYVVAEIGVNHDGDSSVARELIHAAADAEADAVKFQVFAADRLVIREAPAAAYQQPAAGNHASQYDLLRKLELTHDEFTELADYAGHCGVEFLATPFSLEDLEFVIQLGVRAIKLASTDIVNRPLLERAARSGLPVIASTGAAEFDEIADAVVLFGHPDAGPLALLHCISSYPTPENEANLAAIGALGRTFGCVVGFSDHTESLTLGGYATAAGGRIIEKHMTFDRSRIGPDHGFSLEPDGLARYIRNIRQTEVLLGEGTIGLTDRQREVRAVARGSVVAARDIVPGGTLAEADLTVKRPGDGIPPAQFHDLIGRTALTAIPADTVITWDMLSGEPINPHDLEMVVGSAAGG